MPFWLLAACVLTGFRADAQSLLNLSSLGAVARQSSDDSPANLAAQAIDDNALTFSRTLNVSNSFWEMELNRPVSISRLEMVPPVNIDGVVARIYGLSDQILFQTTVSGSSAGATWLTNLPSPVEGRIVRFSLENGQTNGSGDFRVSLSEVQLFGDATPAFNSTNSPNYALGAESYWTRVSEAIAPASNANDGNYATVASTPNSTHDPYWEVDLGTPRALYSVLVAVAPGFEGDMSRATVSVFNEAHDLVLMRHLEGTNAMHDVALPGPVFGQYVRVGIEYAERTRNPSGANWFMGLAEVEVYGRPTNDVGVLSISATSTQIVAGASTTLNWQEEDLYHLTLHPNLGSMGSNTIAGAGSRIVTPPATTEYILVGTNYSGNFVRHLTININGTNLPPRITEFMAVNSLTLRDGNRNFSDWIELHNPNNTPLDLSGHYLSDNPAAPTKWQFPSGSVVQPHGYLVVFASDSNTNQIQDPAGFLHTSFALNNAGESIILTATNGLTVLDAITNFPAQLDDLAYGRTLDGQWAFLEPTPGAANVADSYVGWLAPVDFSHKRGWFTNEFSLTITNPNPDSVLYWSTDGSDPTNVYSGPLSITNVTGVRASVARAGYKSPRIKTHTYLFLDGIINSPTIGATYRGSTYTNRLRQGFLDLPVFAINVPPPDPQWSYLSNYNRERPERMASFEIFMPDGSDIQENCGLIQYGGYFGMGGEPGTTQNPYKKKSWQVRFRSEYGARKLDFPLFQGFGHGVTPKNSFDELNIHAGNHDMSSRGFYMSHRFAADTMLDMGSLNPHGRFVHLFVNGQYMGQFDAHERLTDSFLAEYLGGPTEEYLSVKGNDNAPGTQFILGIPDPDPPGREPWEFVRSNASSYSIIKDWVDMPNLIDFMLVWNWGNAEAEYRSAGARAASPGGSKGFKFWIADADGHLRQQSGVSGVLNLNRTTTTGPGVLFGALLTAGDPDFKMLLADRIYKNFFNGGPMSSDGNLARLNLRMAEITNSMVAECARWGSGGATSIHNRTPENLLSDAQYARDNLFPLRTANLFNIVRTAGWYPPIDPPALNQFGGSVSNGFELIASGSGTIYYTLDGTDPRLPGGGIAPDALSWTAGQVITHVLDLPLNSSWRYYNTNDAPAGAWKDIGYDDSSWPSGSAPMGYGDPGMNTTLVWGSDSNNKWPAYYFRHSFNVTNLAGITQLALGLRRDDGAVVYLNGTELMRDNMPPGPITYTNLASTAVSGAAETTVFPFTVPANLLVLGANVIAIEVHQDKGNSSDLSFDFSLQGSVTNNNSSLTLTLTNETTFTARIWNGTNWSAIAQTTFFLAPLKQPSPGDLVFSEIHYNPPGSDDYEFIEVYNASTNLLDLTGVRLEDGVNFQFPNNYRLGPGAFALVVENVGAFNSRYRQIASPFYHPDINVAGAWVGQLSNEGERLTLVASNGTQLASVDYQVGDSWPGRADGDGSSLELRSPLTMVSTNVTQMNANLDRGGNWRSSALNHGSPGRIDTEPRKVVISEVVSHSFAQPVDWIELQNVTPSPVDLTGYYLSDTFNVPLQFSLTGIVLDPGEFLVLHATNLGFAFSELGDAALLIQAFGTNVLRFEDTVDFPAADRDEPFGRYTRSDAVVDFTELRAKTEGAENALPRVGPLVFSEIMYKPANGFAEFVEIVNITSTNVLLYDPLRPTNVWEISDAVDFKFPSGQQLTPGQVAIICDTNPATFRAQYGVDPSIPVYGPWTGALNNAGETVRIRRPGNPETNGFVPYYRVDRVRYEPLSPWPEQAWNGNISLERITLEGYGNDPANWQPSPAGGTPGGFLPNRAPALFIDGEMNLPEGETVALSVIGTDLDQPWQTVTLSAQNLPAGSSFNPNTGEFTWTTSETDGPGVYQLRFVATDNALVSISTTQTVNVTILESNRPPHIVFLPDLYYPALTPLILDVIATDPDLPAQTLTYGAVGLPTGIGINTASGRISGNAQVQGTYPVTLSVSDNQIPTLSTNRVFTLHITEPFQLEFTKVPNGAPQFSFWTIAGETYEIQFTSSLSPADWQLLQRIEVAGGGLISTPALPGPGFVRILWIRD